MRVPTTNTPEAWDEFWRSERANTWGKGTNPIRSRAAHILSGAGAVHEFGFGTTDFAKLIGKDRWHGHDWSDAAVKKARAEGYTADTLRCTQTPAFRVASICAFQVLSYLAPEDRDEFLERVSGASAIFSDHKGLHEPFASEASFSAYLRRWWPFVSVDSIQTGKAFLFACCGVNG